LYVVREEYHPGIVVLSVHAIPVPVEASVSKFSVNGESNVVMLPLFVSAEEGEAINEIAVKVRANNASNDINAGILVNLVKNRRILRVG